MTDQQRFTRYCIDKIFLSCYDEFYAQKNHEYDLELKDKLMHQLALVQFNNQREHVVRFDLNGAPGTLDIRLRRTRGAYLRTNLIQSIKQKRGYKQDVGLVLHGENFLPLDVQLPFSDFLDELRDVVRGFKAYYRAFVLEHWGVSVDPVVSVSQIEVVKEIYPFSVAELGDYLQAHDDKVMVRFHNQNATIYLNSPDVNTPQLKVYQKAPGLGRFELTFSGKLATQMFNFCKTNKELEEDVQISFDRRFFDLGLSPDLLNLCTFVLPSSSVSFMLQSWFKESIEVINLLQNSNHIQVDRGNRVFAQRLSRKKLILKTPQRGYYKVNPILRQLFKLIEESGVVPTEIKL